MATCPTCGTRFSDSQRLCAHDGSVLEPEQSPELAVVGRVLDGKYRLDGYLSRGGMGAVYKGTHLMLSRPVAVKLISSALVTSPDMVRRFQREARAVTHLNHPNIVRVHDLGQTEDGTLYIAMDLLSGDSLRAVIAAPGALDSARIVHIMGQVISALAHAHRQGIVHRDLKPQNIMISRGSDGQDVATLLDFGIAKTFEIDAHTQLTATGSAVGTPHYMSPEQASGMDVDARSDLYSLGVILYQMLVGEVPFNDPSASAILVKHLTEPPVPPSLKRPDRRIDAALESITMRCLEKKPEARFQSADELARALVAVPIEAVDIDGPTVPVTPAARGPMPPTITAPRAFGTPPVMARTMETPRVTATIPGTTVIRQNTALVPDAPQTLALTVVDVPASRRPRQLAYAAVLLVIAVAAGAAAFISQTAEPRRTDAEPQQAAVTPPVTQTPVTQTPVVVPPKTEPPPAAVTQPPVAPPAAPSVAQGPPATPAVTPPTQKNPAPSAADSGTPLSRQLTSRVRALLTEQKIDGRRLHTASLEMSTRPSSLGRGITADYVATVRTPAGERMFSGNHLGFSELALRTEVIEKVAAEIVAYLASLP